MYSLCAEVHLMCLSAAVKKNNLKTEVSTVLFYVFNYENNAA